MIAPRSPTTAQPCSLTLTHSTTAGSAGLSGMASMGTTSLAARPPPPAEADIAAEAAAAAAPGVEVPLVLHNEPAASAGGGSTLRGVDGRWGVGDLRPPPPLRDRSDGGVASGRRAPFCPAAGFARRDACGAGGAPLVSMVCRSVEDIFPIGWSL